MVLPTDKMDLGHWSQVKAYSPVCVLVYSIKSQSRENNLAHWSQGNVSHQYVFFYAAFNDHLEKMTWGTFHHYINSNFFGLCQQKNLIELIIVSNYFMSCLWLILQKRCNYEMPHEVSQEWDIWMCSVWQKF